MSPPLAQVAIGAVYGRLTILEDLGVVELRPRYRRRMVKVSCTCGFVGDRLFAGIMGGTTKSCGCLHKEGNPCLTTHGKSSTPTYKAWLTMKARCDNPKSEKYKDYGGRGITYDGRWSFYEFFLADMGERPRGMTLDRRDNNGRYCKANCRWASLSTQARNKRSSILIEFGGKTQCLSDWAKELGIARKTLSYRINRGWPLEQALQPTGE